MFGTTVVVPFMFQLCLEGWCTYHWTGFWALVWLGIIVG